MISPSGHGKVRVLRVFSRLNVGGPSIHVILLTAGLDPHGYETRLLVGSEGQREGDLYDLAQEKGVHCIHVPGLGREIRPLSDLLALWRLFKTIREFNPRVVHTHTAKAGFLGRVAARLAGVPVIVHTFHGHVLRGYFGEAKTRLYRFIERTLGQRSAVLIAVSEAVKRDLVELGVAPESKIRVIPLGLQLEELTAPLPRGGLRKAHGIPEASPLIGIVGRLVPIKDLPCFIEAAAIVAQKKPGVYFAIVGDGEQRPELERLVRAKGLEARVHFYGWRRDMTAVYGDLDVAVNCSRNEGTPVALIEALAAARPVVATRVGGTGDVLGEGRYGALVPAADPAALGAAIVATLDDMPASRTKAAEGRAHVMARHSVGRLVSDIDALYRELLAEARA